MQNADTCFKLFSKQIKTQECRHDFKIVQPGQLQHRAATSNRSKGEGMNKQDCGVHDVVSCLTETCSPELSKAMETLNGQVPLTLVFVRVRH